jgi:tRNA (guanine-N7-)-methyltransferase
MRLRNITGSREVIAKSPFVIHDPEQFKGRFSEAVFHNDHEIHLEIGMGKGRFLMELAADNPKINYIGIEKYSSVLLRAIQKMEQLETPLPNLVFIRMDAENITDVFSKGEIAKIYLNFSDPWPKARHDKRRLTHHRFLQIYADLLPVEGLIEFKTDNEALFDFSIEEIEAFPDFDLIKTTRDLHHDDDMNPGNVMTEYEAKFSALGNPIYKLIAKRR